MRRTMRRTDHLVAPTYEIRLTIPAREEIERAWATLPGDPRLVVARGGLVGVRNEIDRPPSAAGIPIVTLRTPPPGLVIVAVDVMGERSLGARTIEDGPWPREFPAAWWDVGAWVPCPTCGAALLWCEAGFVPGWRICLSGHAAQLSSDGRSAKRHAAQDESTLRATRRL